MNWPFHNNGVQVTNLRSWELPAGCFLLLFFFSETLVSPNTNACTRRFACRHAQMDNFCCSGFMNALHRFYTLWRAINRVMLCRWGQHLLQAFSQVRCHLAVASNCSFPFFSLECLFRLRPRTKSCVVWKSQSIVKRHSEHGHRASL